jgi:hypothetical protein
MCLQWCHVTSQVLNNHFACEHCPASIRDAKVGRVCDTCQHRQGETCTLTKQALPQARSCCHHDAQISGGKVSITLANVPASLLDAMQVTTLEDLFWAVESAPEPELVDDDPNHLMLDLQDLAVPFIYGLPADEWHSAEVEP